MASVKATTAAPELPASPRARFDIRTEAADKG